MTINHLTLFNFGVYAGENTFVFHNQKSIVLIGGMNGRGKTTVLEAILLSLYGAASYAFGKSKYRSYGQYLKAFVNRADGSMNCYVELQFQLDKTSSDRYSIRRQWSGAAEKVRETVQVTKNGAYSQFLTDNWAMFIENILPSGLSNFFFLDGEKIEEIALDCTNVRMKESIKALLGISVLERLNSDLTRIISKAYRKKSDAIDATEVEETKARKEQTESALQALDERIEDISTKCAQLDKRLKETNTEYLSQGGDLAARQKELFEQRAALQTRSIQIQEQLVNIASGALPLRLLRDSLTRIQTQAEKERDYQTSIQAVEKMRSILGRYLEENAHDGDAIRAFIQYMGERTENDHMEMIYHLSERGMSQINSLLSSGLDSLYTQTVAFMSEERKNRDESNEIDRYLSIDWNERTLGQIYRKIQSLETEKAQLEKQLETEKKTRAFLHGDALKAASDYEKRVEELLVNLETNDNTNRIVRYAHYAKKILRQYILCLQKRKTEVLSETMTECYRKLFHKKNFIKRIALNAETLDFLYYNANGEIVDGESLSAGEKQLMVIALLWALSICASKKFPVVIDAPLSRLDSNHRHMLLTAYFPQASEQTIILSTDSEIRLEDYQLLQPEIGDAYTIVYDDNKKSSSIQSGYFTGECHDNQTN